MRRTQSPSTRLLSLGMTRSLAIVRSLPHGAQQLFSHEAGPDVTGDEVEAVGHRNLSRGSVARSKLTMANCVRPASGDLGVTRMVGFFAITAPLQRTRWPSRV